MNKDQLVIVIKNAVASILHSKDLQPNYLSEDTEIFGAGSQIDSLDLVTVVVAIEQAIIENTGRQITLVDEQSLMSEDSPFRTISTLAKLAMERIALE